MRLMQVTHVVRGEDHISNTPRQILIYEALGFTPPAFAHLALVMGPDHTPLSKRHGATSVAEFRAKGYLPEALVNYLALIGWSPGADDELLPVDELARRFSIAAVGHSAGVFDEDKLAWADRHYLRIADPARLVRLTLDYFRREGLASDPTPEGLDYLAAVVPMASGSVDRLDEIPSRLRFLFSFDPVAALRDPDVREVLSHEGAREVIESLARELSRGPRMESREAVPRRRWSREAADRAEGEGAVPPDPGRADGDGGRARAGSGGAGDRPRRRVAGRRRPGADPGLPRARGGVRGSCARRISRR